MIDPRQLFASPNYSTGLDIQATPTPLMVMPDSPPPQRQQSSGIDTFGLGMALGNRLQRRADMSAAHHMYDTPVRRPPFQTLGPPFEQGEMA